MRVDGKKIVTSVERALYYRDQCLEWAAAAPLPELATSMRKAAADWEKFAVNIQRDAVSIADSHLLIAETERLLNGKARPG